MSGRGDETPRTPRTPPVLYLLALVVVAAVWLGYRNLGSGAEDELTRWAAETLDLAAVAARLKDPSADHETCGHALVQLARHVQLAREDPSATPPLAALLPDLERIARGSDARLRQLVIVAATYLDAPGAAPLLAGLLDDADGKVALNAAIGLAARNDPRGAPLLAGALEGVRREDVATRRELLAAFRHVAQERHRPLLEEQRRLAALDHDEESVAMCARALARLDGGTRQKP